MKRLPIFLLTFLLFLIPSIKASAVVLDEPSDCWIEEFEEWDEGCLANMLFIYCFFERSDWDCDIFFDPNLPTLFKPFENIDY